MRLSSFVACLALLAATTVTAADSPIGKEVKDFKARDYRGRETSLAEFADSKAIVVAFLGTECPLAKMYGPRLEELAAEYKSQGVAFIAIDSNRQDSIAEIANYARVHGVTFPILKDVGNTIADQFGARRTPEVFLLDKDRVVRYAGRIDDQYGLGNSSAYAQAKVRHRHLVTALDELLAGKTISQPRSETPGCLIGRVREPDSKSAVTYSKQVARILQKNCVECHRPGQIAPFALTNYEEVSGWADMIEEVVRDQRMPPWHADPKIGKFHNDRSMSDADKETLYAWVKAGAPEGNPADVPAPIEYPETWQLGKPDQVVYMNDKPYDIPAEGTVEYEYFMADPGWTEDHWIKSNECLLGNRSVVHHIFVFAIDPSNPLAQRHGPLGTGIQPGLGDNSVRLIAGAAPGTPPATGPEGAATLVKAGTKLLFQMHYTPNGSPQQDRTCVGFYFAKPEEVTRAVDVQMAINPSFTIPAQADNYPVKSAHKFGKDAMLINLTPHMHLRGKSFRYDLKYPDGKVETILNVPHYDFNWQVTYLLETPKFVPAGTEMQCLAHFDNSDTNLANPDPNSSVSWGDQTWEEMMIGWFTETDDVYPSDVSPDQTRAARFVAMLGANPPKLSKILSRAAEGSLKSDAAMEKFLDRLNRELPQVDRVCVSKIDDGKVHFLAVAQPAVLDYPLGRGDRTFAAADATLARYIEGGKLVTNAALPDAGADMAAMRRALGSSIHVPITVNGAPAVVSYWSKEKEAFPPAAVAFLTDVSKKIGAP
ncbi:MAG TPA: redoxin domain-containing protein [Pirellulales bacterium]|nr:redoxin domain-containing protein [Pirellulales bacterium]